ncbi:MAG: TetR/AcrR family transcriptional regulator [Myxococcota bacterium]
MPRRPAIELTLGQGSDDADGRVRRGARNRSAIVDALAALVSEGELVPTAEQVAQRAGVGTRTVFRHFEDMDSLFARVSERVVRGYDAVIAQPFEGSLDERIGEMVRRRVYVWERIMPFKRSANAQRWQSDFLQMNHDNAVRRQRDWLRRALPELSRAAPQVVEALDLVVSLEAWERLRVDQRLGRERAREVMETSVRALLASLH